MTTKTIKVVLTTKRVRLIWQKLKENRWYQCRDHQINKSKELEIG
jgi:hypothetical protein